MNDTHTRRLQACGVGTLQASIQNCGRAKITVFALSPFVYVDSDVERVVLTDHTGSQLRIESVSEKGPNGKPQEVLPGPDRDDLLGFVACAEDERGGGAWQIAAALQETNACVIVCDKTKTGDGHARLLARLAVWALAKRVPTLAKALKPRVSLPKPKWARDVLKAVEKAKTRAGAVDKMTQYLDTLC